MNLQDLQENWQMLAEEDPLWAILTRAGKEGGRWDLEEFLETGRGEIRAALAELNELGLELRYGRALDFGCGVGRLTHALAEHFGRVQGVDIAPAMLKRAREIHAHIDNCDFVLNEAPNLSIFPDASFDLVYSKITLQHMHPRYANAFIAEFARVLAPRGALVIQLAGRPRRLKIWLAHRVMPAALRRLIQRRRHPGKPVMEMYGQRPTRVTARVASMGLRVLRVRRDRAAGPAWTSFQYVAVKPDARGTLPKAVSGEDGA